MIKLHLELSWGKFDVEIHQQRYAVDNSPSLTLWDDMEGPLARLTICIPGTKLEADEILVKVQDENAEIAAYLLQHYPQHFQMTNKTSPDGIYPIWKYKG